MASRDGLRAPRRVPPVLLPWLVYVGVTLVAPAANGAAHGERFAEHTVITLGVSGALLLLWLAAARERPPRRRPPATGQRSDRGHVE
jgi:hypothetical protein